MPRLAVPLLGLGLVAAAVLAASTWYRNWALTAAERVEDAALPLPYRRLLPLHQRQATPQPGDWRDQHPERGQSYREFLGTRPERIDPRRQIVVLPLGDCSTAQRQLAQATADFIHRYFQLPAQLESPLALVDVPADAQRSAGKQLLTTWLLREVLLPRKPRDAVALIGLTETDLWPGEGWNFVFGQTDLRDRVAVWSSARLGEGSEDRDASALRLRRTIHIAVHELGHALGLPHCTAYACLMQGGNHLAELDRQPLWLCPHCLAKVCHVTGANPEKRSRQLAEFAAAHKLQGEETYWNRAADLLRGPPPPPAAASHPSPERSPQ